MDPDPMTELPAELKQNMTRYKAPPGLKRRIRYMLGQQSRIAVPPRRPAALWWQRWMPLGASFACGTLLAISVMGYRDAGRDDGQIEQQVVASHVRSLMVSHLTDVASSDQHTVKPWFTGKLNYAPPVIDLAEDGFPLIGGRLDYLQDKPIAALVYRRRGHTINVFVLPSHQTPQPSASRLMARQGYHLASWTQAGMRFWAISDVGSDELAKFSAAMQAAPA
jgi:anti-sigma factor RsiW